MEKRRVKGFRAAAGLLAVLSLSACPAPRGPADSGDDSISGEVRYPGYRTQASIKEVATAATVSLIDPGPNETVATALTDAKGRFKFSFNKLARSNQVYYLEAVKGLSSNAVGKDAVRVRTFILNQGGGWRSLTNAIPGLPLVINESTTALCLMVSLRAPSTPIDPSVLIGRISPGIPDGESPDTFTNSPALTGIPDGDFGTLRALVAGLLVEDRDPFDGVRYEGDAYALKSGFGASLNLAVLEPALAAVGDTITLRGSGFTGATASVTFPAALPADILQVTESAIRVRVPAGATTGAVTLTVGGLSATASFTLVPTISGGLKP